MVNKILGITLGVAAVVVMSFAAYSFFSNNEVPLS